MKLSDAIRLGAMTGPQAFGVSVDGEATCALGAALRACGREGRDYCDIDAFYPVASVVCVQPVTGEHGLLMLSVIRELNDRHRWTREQIADWVETVEREREAQTPPPQPAEAAR